MEIKSGLIVVLLMVLSSKCSGIRIGPCANNKIAPQDGPEGKTFGLLFGFRPFGTNCGSGVVSDPANTDYDPVNSEEDNGGHINPPVRPVGGISNWWSQFSNNWFSRPPRPPAQHNQWLWGWLGPFGPNKPPTDDNIKPVHEHIDDDLENVVWKPGYVVGGPSNQIVPVVQDLSNWSRPPTPRPTRPSIPGYGNNSRNRETIVGSFIDLFFKR